MPARPDRLLRHIRRLVSAPMPAPDSDAALLESFARRHDEAAFTTLVNRYGGLVFSVCRRVLGDSGAAEDCTQATFLVLARKAAAIRRAEELPAWLHGTAYRLALRTRRADHRRRLRETHSAQTARSNAPADPLDELTARELLVVLDEELERLPEVYRLPVILCGLEGLSQEEAAVRLGWTRGSVKGRLERARARLHARLTRRGLTLMAVLGAVEMARAASDGGPLPAALAGATVRSALTFLAGRSAVNNGLSPIAVTLAEGALKAMYLSKLKMTLVVLAVLTLAGTGLGWLGRGPSKGAWTSTPMATAAEPGDRPRPPAVADDRADRDRRDELLARAKKDLRVLADEAEARDEQLSNKVIEARERLVELEDRLRLAEAERQEPLPSLEESRLAHEKSRLENNIDISRQRLEGGDLNQFLAQLEKQRAEVDKQLDQLRKQRAAMRAKIATELIALRKQIVRQEEELRRLERKRDSAREEAERRREALEDRLRRLEDGGQAAPATSERSLRSLERRLKAIESEIGQMRQEIRKLRRSGKGG
jgi:RNA polymerase sigma factor (sigma-70 family)